VALSTAACATDRLLVAVPPEPALLATPAPVRPSVALVLGAGGTRGFAHLGVLKVLDEAGLRPDIVVGASVGSVIGALYCAGLGAAELERIALEVEREDVLDFAPLSGGVFSGERLQAFVNRAVRGRPIEALPTPLAVVATDRESGALVTFTRGDTGLAVRASTSIPVVFASPRFAGKTYVDAGVADPLPTLIARRLGAQVVVAVNLTRRPDIEGSGRGGADLVIDLALPRTRVTDFSQREAQIRAGEAAARAVLPSLRALTAAVRAP
jgi:NTE family protein